MYRFIFAAVFALLGQQALAADNTAKTYQAIDIKGFSDIIHHWHNQNDKDQRAQYTPAQITAIADNLLTYQRTNGGWPVNKDPLRMMTEAEINAELANQNATDSSLDNRNTYPQVRYLAEVYQQVPEPKYKQGASKGLTFLLDQQLANGGWTHSPPTTKKYYGHITIMDEVMSGVLTLLRDINNGDPAFAFLSEAERTRVKKAQLKGDQLLLQLQVRQKGVATIWAGQYERNTLAPIDARAFELPSLVSRESVDVVRYLMGFEQPSAEVIAAVEAAVAWFEANAITGIRVDTVQADTTRFDHHSSDKDLVVVKDANAPRIWARFYDLNSNTPFFANRDGKRVATLAEVARERRTGYSWYGYWPEKLISQEYPQWRKRLGLD